MGNLNENITPSEARQLIDMVSKLAKWCSFTKLEMAKITKICSNAVDREIERIENAE